MNGAPVATPWPFAVGVPPSSAVRLWLHVADLAAAHEELRGRGVDIVRPPVREPWGPGI